jgi:hypothetical protein
LLCIKSVPVSENKEASNKESGDKNPAVAFVRTALILEPVAFLSVVAIGLLMRSCLSRLNLLSVFRQKTTRGESPLAATRRPD